MLAMKRLVDYYELINDSGQANSFPRKRVGMS